MPVRQTLLKSQRLTFSSLYRSADAQRAVLGCYYLSCGISLFGFDKPQNLTFNHRVQQITEHLTTYGEHLLDRNLLASVDLCRIAEDVRRVLRVRDVESAQSEDVRLKMDLQYVRGRLQAWLQSHTGNCTGA